MPPPCINRCSPPRACPARALLPTSPAASARQIHAPPPSILASTSQLRHIATRRRTSTSPASSTRLAPPARSPSHLPPGRQRAPHGSSFDPPHRPVLSVAKAPPSIESAASGGTSADRSIGFWIAKFRHYLELPISKSKVCALCALSQISAFVIFATEYFCVIHPAA